MKFEPVKHFLMDLQDTICNAIEDEDGYARFIADSWTSEIGTGRSCILSDGQIFEKAGIGFSHVKGEKLPQSATTSRPELVGRSWQAVGVSMVIHPENPHVPTSHANLRFFVAEKANENPVWWFGGGFDLTPFYPIDEDCKHFHQVAHDAVSSFGNSYYSSFKSY